MRRRAGSARGLRRGRARAVAAHVTPRCDEDAVAALKSACSVPAGTTGCLSDARRRRRRLEVDRFGVAGRRSGITAARRRSRREGARTLMPEGAFSDGFLSIARRGRPAGLPEARGADPGAGLDRAAVPAAPMPLKLPSSRVVSRRQGRIHAPGSARRRRRPARSIAEGDGPRIGRAGAELVRAAMADAVGGGPPISCRRRRALACRARSATVSVRCSQDCTASWIFDGPHTTKKWRRSRRNSQRHALKLCRS